MTPRLDIFIEAKTLNLVKVLVRSEDGFVWLEIFGPPKIALNALAEWISEYSESHNA